MATLRPMWIKICGMTSADAIAAAAEAQVDAIGFVFAPSPRQVTPGQAAQLAALAPPGILRIAVAQHPLQMKVDEICRILKPDYFQTDVEDLRELKIPREKMNIHGGGCALGHPIGATGARILVTLISALKQHHLKRGIASLCIGGGEATAIAVENIS